MSVERVGALFRIWAFAALTAGICTPSQTCAQTPAATPVPIEIQYQQVEDRISQLEPRLLAAKEIATVTKAREFGVSVDLLQEIAQRLEDIKTTYEANLNALKSLESLRKTQSEHKTDVDTFNGLPDPPPYRIQYVDSLRDQSDLKRMEKRAEELRKEQYEATLEGLRKSLDDIQAQRSEKESSAGGADATALAADYELRSVMLEETYTKARSALVRDNIKVEEVKIGIIDLELDLLQKKIDIASSRAPFTRREYDEHRQELDEVSADLQKQIKQSSSRNDQYQRLLSECRQKLDSATDSLTRTALQEEADHWRSMTERTTGLIQTLQEGVDVVGMERRTWEIRFNLANPADEPLDLPELSKWIRDSVTRIGEVEASYVAQIAFLQVRLGELNTSLQKSEPGSTRRGWIEEEIGVVRQHETTLSTVYSRVKEVGRISDRLKTEVDARLNRRSFGEILSDVTHRAGRVWNYAIIQGENEDGTVSYRLTVGKIVIAIFILIGGALVGRRFTAILAKQAIKRFRIEESRAAVIQTVTFYIFLAFAVLFALNFINVPLTIFAFAGGALAIGIGFGAQNFINNFLSGLFLLLEQPIRINDVVEVDGQYGRITNIGWRCSNLRLFSGVEILVPNSMFLEQKVTNWTHSDKMVRFTVRVGVAYGSPTRKTAELLKKAVSEHEKVLKFPEPVVIFEDFGDNALAFDVYFWVEMNTMMEARVVRSEIRHKVDEYFREADIVIAFPQRDVHLDSLSPVQVKLVKDE